MQRQMETIQAARRERTRINQEAVRELTLKKATTDQTMTKTQMTEKVRYRITMKTMSPITIPAKIPEKPIPELTILTIMV